MGGTTKQKDLYKQMFIQQMQLYAADNEVVVVQESQDHSTKKKKDDFYDFQSDDESESQSNVEIEANDYLNNAKLMLFLQIDPWPAVDFLLLCSYHRPQMVGVFSLLCLSSRNEIETILVNCTESNCNCN